MKSQNEQRSEEARWVGMDVSKRTFDAALAGPEQRFPSTPLRALVGPENRSAFVFGLMPPASHSDGIARRHGEWRLRNPH